MSWKLINLSSGEVWALPPFPPSNHLIQSSSLTAVVHKERELYKKNIFSSSHSRRLSACEDFLSGQPLKSEEGCPSSSSSTSAFLSSLPGNHVGDCCTRSSSSSSVQVSNSDLERHTRAGRSSIPYSFCVGRNPHCGLHIADRGISRLHGCFQIVPPQSEYILVPPSLLPAAQRDSATSHPESYSSSTLTPFPSPVSSREPLQEKTHSPPTKRTSSCYHKPCDGLTTVESSSSFSRFHSTPRECVSRLTSCPVDLLGRSPPHPEKTGTDTSIHTRRKTEGNEDLQHHLLQPSWPEAYRGRIFFHDFSTSGTKRNGTLLRYPPELRKAHETKRSELEQRRKAAEHTEGRREIEEEKEGSKSKVAEKGEGGDSVLDTIPAEDPSGKQSCFELFEGDILNFGNFSNDFLLEFSPLVLCLGARGNRLSAFEGGKKSGGTFSFSSCQQPSRDVNTDDSSEKGTVLLTTASGRVKENNRSPSTPLKDAPPASFSKKSTGDEKQEKEENSDSSSSFKKHEDGESALRDLREKCRWSGAYLLTDGWHPICSCLLVISPPPLPKVKLLHCLLANKPLLSSAFFNLLLSQASSSTPHHERRKSHDVLLASYSEESRLTSSGVTWYQDKKDDKDALSSSSCISLTSSVSSVSRDDSIHPFRIYQSRGIYLAGHLEKALGHHRWREMVEKLSSFSSLKHGGVKQEREDPSSVVNLPIQDEHREDAEIPVRSGKDRNGMSTSFRSPEDKKLFGERNQSCRSSSNKEESREQREGCSRSYRAEGFYGSSDFSSLLPMTNDWRYLIKLKREVSSTQTKKEQENGEKTSRKRKMAGGPEEEQQQGKEEEEGDGEEDDNHSENPEVPRELLPADVLESCQLLARYALRPSAIRRQDFFRGLIAFLFSADQSTGGRGREDQERRSLTIVKGSGLPTPVFSNSLDDIIRTGGGTTLVLPKGVPPGPPPLASSPRSSSLSSSSPSGECSASSLRRNFEFFSASFKEPGRCFSVQLAMRLGELLRERGIGRQTSCDSRLSPTEDHLDSSSVSSLACSTASSCLSSYGEKILNDERMKRDKKEVKNQTRQGSSDRGGGEGQEGDRYHDERTFALILPSDLHFLSNDAEGRSLLKDLLMALYLSPSYLSSSVSSLPASSTSSSSLRRGSPSSSPKKTGKESLRSLSSSSSWESSISSHVLAVRLISEQHVFLSMVTGRRLFSSTSDICSSSLCVQEREEKISKKGALYGSGTSLSDGSPSQTIEEPRVFTKIREEAWKEASSLFRLLHHSSSSEKRLQKSLQSLKKGERRSEEERGEEEHDQQVNMTLKEKTKDDKRDSASLKGDCTEDEEEDEERERKEHGDVMNDPHNTNHEDIEELREDNAKKGCYQSEKIRTKEENDKDEKEEDDIEEDLHTTPSSIRGLSSCEGKKRESVPFNRFIEHPTPDCHSPPRHLHHRSRIRSSSSPYPSSLDSKDIKSGETKKTPAQRICLLRYYEGSHVISSDDEKAEEKNRTGDDPNKRRSPMKKSRRAISSSSSSSPSFSGCMDERYGSSLSSGCTTSRGTREGMKKCHGGCRSSSSCSRSMEVELLSSLEEEKNLLGDKENEARLASQNLILLLSNKGEIMRGKENMKSGETDHHPTPWVSTKTFKKSTPRSCQWRRGVCTPRVIPLKVFESSENIEFRSSSISPSDAVITARQGCSCTKERSEISVHRCRDSLRKGREISTSSDEASTSEKSPEGRQTTSKVTFKGRGSMKATLPSRLYHENEEDERKKKKNISQSRNHGGEDWNAESEGETSVRESRTEERRDWRPPGRRSLKLSGSKASFACQYQEEDGHDRRQEEDAKGGRSLKEMSPNERLPPLSLSSSSEQKKAKDTNEDEEENTERSDSYHHLHRTIQGSQKRHKGSSETDPSSPSIHKPDKGGGATDVPHSDTNHPGKSLGARSSSESIRKRRLLPWR
ncbi:hypothetical protein CSUI_000996 [Cystoisospora suis]|uniref:Uncharacterized protein n=1 Tax=Cystoisospora suis TaxID=483139 RepID=A0A2C6LEC3_9APIC|nr:hypothetical protein CSUI_000996 [Cystoisospora suis]